MQDQATRLREIATEIKKDHSDYFDPDLRKHSRAKVFAVTSGKGGVGKSHIAVNVALKMKQAGYKVLLMDADINLANTNILMGHAPSRSLADAIIKGYPISEVIYTGPEGLHVLPGGSGFAELTNLPEDRKNNIIRQLSSLEYNYDYIILDTPAGIDKQVLDFLIYASKVLLIITPEPTSIADSYALLKILTLQEKKVGINIVVNQVNSLEHAKDIFSKFNLVVQRFLKIKINFLNYIVSDKNIIRATMQQKPMVLSYPNSPASRCIDNLMERIVTRGDIKCEKYHSSFFQRVSGLSLFN